jgi:hypothetical protein
VAWAAGADNAWWWPDALCTAFWPAEAPREESMAAFSAAFATLGYRPCADGLLIAGVEKIAIYVSRGRPTHVARQLPDGRWTSKLGQDIDLTHTLDSLEGATYGAVAAFLARPRGPREGAVVP